MRALQYLAVLVLGMAIGHYVPTIIQPSNAQQVVVPAAPGAKAALFTWQDQGTQGVTAALPSNGTFRAWIPKGYKYKVQFF